MLYLIAFLNCTFDSGAEHIFLTDTGGKNNLTKSILTKKFSDEKYYDEQTYDEKYSD